MPDLNQKRDAAALPPGKRKRKQKRIRTWDSSLLSAEIGPYVFVALTDSGALKAEGRRMQHCVATYIDICRMNAARIFSVRDAISGQPVATLSLIWIDDYWRIDQLKGLRNAEVAIHQAIYFDGEETVIDIEMTELYFAAQELLLRYRRAWAMEQH